MTAPLIFLWQKGLMRRSKPSSWCCVDGKVQGTWRTQTPLFCHAEINKENPSLSHVGFLVRQSVDIKAKINVGIQGMPTLSTPCFLSGPTSNLLVVVPAQSGVRIKNKRKYWWAYQYTHHSHVPFYCPSCSCVVFVRCGGGGQLPMMEL